MSSLWPTSIARRLLLSAGIVAGALLAASGCGGGAPKGPADLVFVSTRDGDYALFGMGADGSRQRRLTHERGDPATPSGLSFQVQPAWSPDGGRIAFASRRAGNFAIYVMLADGTGTRRLTSGKQDDMHPTWSPDGKRIAFVRGFDGKLEVMNADGGGVHSLTNAEGAEIDPTWSPDGGWIVYSGRAPGTSLRELWLVRPDGSQRHRLTSLNRVSTSPGWSPDGKRIVFGSQRNGARAAIFIIGVDGKGLRPLTGASGQEQIEPAWSPDGKTIAFSLDGAIAVSDLEGTTTTLTDARHNDSSPAWNPHPAKRG